MSPIFAFTLQFLSVALVSFLAARWYLASFFKTRPLGALLVPLVAAHILRTIGLIYLTPGAFGIDPALPKSFLYATGYGDLLAAVLALIATLLLFFERRGAYAWTWFFNIVGCLDLLFAMGNGVRIEFLSYQVGVAWFLPAFIVPALLVSHLVIFYLLIRHPAAGQVRR